MTTVPMAQCKRRLAVLWFIGAGIIFSLIFGQTALGKYGDQASQAWNWILPTIMPTLSLIVGVLVMETVGKNVKNTFADAFLFKLTFGISTAYLLAVLLTLLVQPFSTLTVFELMSQSNFWLGPFQGLVAAALGAFFVKTPEN
jgi:hypothetical protein